MTKNPPKLIVIVGETASGKSSLALQLAQQFNGGIISADSWAVYKGFDIGTAKPTKAERALVPHFCVDVADPAVGFSAAEFQRLAKHAIAELSQQNKLPILVGGTGLYIDSILYDYSFLPPSAPELRLGLNSLSLPDLLKKADSLGLDTAGIDIRNKRRVIRLIENNGRRPTKTQLRPNTLVLGVRRDRAELEKRIYERIDNMVESGFVEEVRKLGLRYGWDCEPMKAPGYRAFAAYVRGEETLDAAKQRVAQNDLQLAKKQRTWFKRNDSIQWVSDPSYAVDLVTTFLSN